MAKLLLVRHGETKENGSERFWGRTDVELSDVGLRQAEQLRDRLTAEDISTIYASNLKRALQTAQVIASRHKLSVIPCPELQEVDFGSLEGLTFGEISRKYPALVESWLNWNISLRFPDGESVTNLNNRVIRFLHRLEEYAREETVLVVAHSGVLRLLICNLLGIELRHWRQIRLDLASISVVETYPEVAILNSLNDVSHL